jgi:hypothetical protein
MQIVLLNFSDSPRSLVDRRNRTITVAVGEMRNADVHESHYRLLKNGTFLALPQEIEIPSTVVDALHLMSETATLTYDELLQKFWVLVGRDADLLRPSREYIRLALRDHAQNALAVAGVGKPAPKRVSIVEQGDATTRDDSTADIVNDEEDATGDPQPSSPTPKAKVTGKPRSSSTRPRMHVRTHTRA